MLLLEDKSSISGLSKMSEEEQRKFILSYAKTNNCEIYFGIRGKQQKDNKTFKIITDCGVILQRIEYNSFLETKSTIVWSIIINGKERIVGNFMDIVEKFNTAIGG